jgi:hypothetical protein
VGSKHANPVRARAPSMWDPALLNGRIHPPPIDLVMISARRSAWSTALAAAAFTSPSVSALSTSCLEAASSSSRSWTVPKLQSEAGVAGAVGSAAVHECSLQKSRLCQTVRPYARKRGSKPSFGAIDLHGLTKLRSKCSLAEHVLCSAQPAGNSSDQPS